MKLRNCSYISYISCVVLMLICFQAVVAQEPIDTDSHLLVVSRPAAPIMATDPQLGVIYKLPTDLSASQIYLKRESEPTSLDYLRLADTGEAYLSFGTSDTNMGGVLKLDALPDLNADLNTDMSMLSGENVDLIDPRGLMIDSKLGMIIVADFATGLTKVFDSKAEGDVLPLVVFEDVLQTTETDGKSDVKPWGLELNRSENQLMIATTVGTILVYDNYIIPRGERGPDRMIIPTFEGEKVSSNLRGLFYDANQDLLFVSDFGPAHKSDQEGFDIDGKLFVIPNASQADGETEVRLLITGLNTSLGNPSDLVFDGSSIFVGEKVFDLVLRFDDVLNYTGRVDLAPSGAVSVPKPESLVLVKGRP